MCGFLQAENAYNEKKYKCAKRLKICSVSWSIAGVVAGIIVPIIITLGTIYGISIINKNGWYWHVDYKSLHRL